MASDDQASARSISRMEDSTAATKPSSLITVLVAEAEAQSPRASDTLEEGPYQHQTSVESVADTENGTAAKKPLGLVTVVGVEPETPPPRASDADVDILLLEEGAYHDDPLQPHSPAPVPILIPLHPKRYRDRLEARFLRHARNPVTLLPVLAILAFGSFLGNATVARQHIPRDARLILVTLTSSLVPTRSAPKRAARAKPGEDRLRQWGLLAIAYLALILSAYALIGAADPIHVEVRAATDALVLARDHDHYWDLFQRRGWTSVVGAWRPGYLMRAALVAISWWIVRATGVYRRPTRWLLLTWTWCFIWMYADLLTFFFPLMDMLSQATSKLIPLPVKPPPQQIF